MHLRLCYQLQGSGLCRTAKASMSVSAVVFFFWGGGYSMPPHGYTCRVRCPDAHLSHTTAQRMRTGAVVIGAACTRYSVRRRCWPPTSNAHVSISCKHQPQTGHCGCESSYKLAATLARKGIHRVFNLWAYVVDLLYILYTHTYTHV